MKQLLCWGGIILAVLVVITVVHFANHQPQEIRFRSLYTLSVFQLMFALSVMFSLRKSWSFIGENELLCRVSLGRVCTVAVGALVLFFSLVSITLLTDRGSMVLPRTHQIVWLIFYQFVLISLSEEIIFRGLPFALLPARAWSPILSSSLLFALFHLNNGIFALPYYFAMGLLFGILRRFGMSLFLLAIGHGLFNVYLRLIWPIAGFQFGASAFYTVMPAILLCLSALAGWILSRTNSYLYRIHSKTRDSF